ncbi:MAG: VapE domain-containing protein, partial [Cyanobacteria bacterium J06600_6]
MKNNLSATVTATAPTTTNLKELSDNSDFNYDEARSFISLLGQSKSYFRTIDKKKELPPRNLEGHIDDVLDQLTAENKAGKSVYVVANGQGNKDADVNQCNVLFYEHDNIPKEESLVLWKELELPEPSIQVDTGGKSIHSYWVLNEPVEASIWRDTISELIEIAKSDKAVKNPSRVMRLPGFKHPKTGNLAHIVSQSNLKYNFEEIRTKIANRLIFTQELEAERLYVESDETSGQKTNPLGYQQSAEYSKVLSRMPGSYREEILNGVEEYQDNTAIKIANQLAGLNQNDECCQKCAKHLIALFLVNCPKKDETPWTREDVERLWTSAASKPREVLIGKPRKLSLREQIAEIKNHYKDKIRRNLLDNSVVTPWGEGFELSRAYLKILEEINIQIAKTTAMDVIVEIADENAFHPVTDYLDGLKTIEQPGKARELLDSYLQQIMHCEDEYLRKAIMIWLVGAVKRIYEPGCKFDLMLILQGTEGTNKSRFFQTLGNTFYGSCKDLSFDKDVLMAVQQSWLVEVDECDSSLRTRHTGTTKSVISTAIDNYRRPYASAVTKVPRTSVFGGSTNAQEIFLESGDNRRYLLVPGFTKTNKIDIELLETLRDLIWACAKALYLDNFPVYIDDVLQAYLAKLNQRAVVTDPRQADLEDYLSDKKQERVLWQSQLVPEFFGQPTCKRTEAFILKNILTSLGWKHTTKRVNGHPVKGWFHEDFGKPSGQTHLEIDSAQEASAQEASAQEASAQETENLEVEEWFKETSAQEASAQETENLEVE